MKRRDFFQASAAIALGAGTFENILFGQQTERVPVTLLGMSNYDKDVEKEIADIMTADDLNLRGKKVLLKPNFVEAHPERPINTHITVIAHTAHACLRLGAAQVIVGEASGHRRDPWFSVLNPSLRAILDKKVKCLDLNHGDAVEIRNRGRWTGLPAFYLAKPVADADILISMPKMKTHHWMCVTLCLKNLFGVLPGIYYGWPKNLLHFRGIDKSIVDLASTVKIHYNVIDGVIGMEGDGPIMGRSKAVGALVLSPHALAADATATRLMGFDPRKIPYFVQAGKFLPGLKQENIEMRGERPKKFSARFACLENFKPIQGGPFF